MKHKALSGLRVVEYGKFISAPYCTKMMADLGAEVIKVEEPVSGDESRRYGPFINDIPDLEKSGLFLYLNANKLSVTLDLKQAGGRQLLKEILNQSDVLVENHHPGFMSELGLDFASLRENNPRLIVTSITPFGQSGPYSRYKGYAINASALGGMSFIIGDPNREPLTLPLSQGHFQSGSMGATATMAALFARDLTGRGQHVDISESDVWVCLHTGMVVSAFLFHNRKRMRGGHRTPGAYPYTVLPCKDGHVFLIALDQDQWQRFVDVMGNPEWTKDPRFEDQRRMAQYADELDSLLSPWLMSHTKAEIFELCRQSHIPFTPVLDTAEIVNSPHFNERGFFHLVNHSLAGKLKYPGFPYRLSETPGEIHHPAPMLGQHNEMIFCDRLSHSREELADLGRSGVV